MKIGNEVDAVTKYVLIQNFVNGIRDRVVGLEDSMRYFRPTEDDAVEALNTARKYMAELKEYAYRYEAAKAEDTAKVSKSIYALQTEVKRLSKEVEEKDAQIEQMHLKFQEEVKNAVDKEVEELKEQIDTALSLNNTLEDVKLVLNKYLPFKENQQSREEAPKKERTVKIKKEDISKITDAYESGTSVNDLASIYGVSPNRIRQILREKGVYIAGHQKKSSK